MMTRLVSGVVVVVFGGVVVVEKNWRGFVNSAGRAWKKDCGDDDAVVAMGERGEWWGCGRER